MYVEARRTLRRRERLSVRRSERAQTCGRCCGYATTPSAHASRSCTVTSRCMSAAYWLYPGLGTVVAQYHCADIPALRNRPPGALTHDSIGELAVLDEFNDIRATFVGPDLDDELARFRLGARQYDARRGVKAPRRE